MDLQTNIICFEYILLEFNRLIEWSYTLKDEFLTKCADAIIAREKLIKSLQMGEMNYKEIQEVVAYDTNFENHNIEQLSAKLFFDLTKNT